jgi:UDP-GlcNAc:undecaprenyl-phosphate GlcNAc-1-phosphate transferase
MFSSIYLALIINIFFFLFFDQIQNKLNIYDKPDLIRKIHKKTTSAAGGILFTICLVSYFTSNIAGLEQNYLTFKENFSMLLLVFFFFILGVYDDKFFIQPYPRLLLSTFFILILLLLNENFVIKELSFSFYHTKISLKDFSIFFTVICILLFINACNMFDGINMQFGLYVMLLSIIFWIKGVLPNLQICIVICSLFFLYFNFKDRLFIGNNGSLVLGAFFSLLFIKIYNSDKTFLYVDEIFLYMSILGFDLIRVSFSRLINGKNMFTADKNHIHHLLNKKFNLTKTLIIIQTIITLPIIYAFLTKQYIYACFVSLTMYIALIAYIYKTKNN